MKEIIELWFMGTLTVCLMATAIGLILIAINDGRKMKTDRERERLLLLRLKKEIIQLEGRSREL